MLKLTSILNSPSIFLFFQKLIGAHRIKLLIIKNINFKPNTRVLDVGCGFGNLLEYLPKDINYLGVDMNKAYISYAKRKYGSRGRFICEDVSKLSLKKEKFDVIIISSLLHHLSDKEVEKLFKSLMPFLKQNTNVISADGVYLKNQSSASKFVLNQDRGKYVRSREDYLLLIKKYFSKTNCKLVSNLLNIPVDLIFISMRK